MNALVVFSLLIAASAAELCNIACQFNYDPVCANDGNTYGNLCEMETRGCMTRMNLKVEHQGACAEVESETCNELCPMNIDPVCGSDGVTYDNDCVLVSLSCLSKSKVIKTHDGECVAKADKVKQITGCEIACPTNYDPVCGSDEKTYGNLCELQSLSCQRKSNTKVAYNGECSKVAKDSQVAGCNMLCQFNYAPVCGSDGKTYGNECELASLACLRKSGVTLATHGEC